MVSNRIPGQTWPRNTALASSVGGSRQQNSVASTRPPGRVTRASSAAARRRLTNMVTASANTTSKWSSGYGNDLMSASSTLTRSATPAAETFAIARLRINGAMSAATTCAPYSRASRIAVVPTPQPMSSTRSPGLTAASPSSRSVEALPPGWMTRLPRTAKNA
jgi:hypothetical protein